MDFLYKLEKKLGKYSIRNLPLILALLFAFNYLLSAAAPDVYNMVVFSPIQIFYNHQYWRLITWIFTTPGAFGRWTVVSLVCLYFIGAAAERGMGTFMYNLYTLGSMLINLLVSVIVSAYIYFSIGGMDNLSKGIDAAIEGDNTLKSLEYLGELYYGGVYINFTIPICVFFAFAIAYTDTTVNFMFLFPMKAKYIAAIDFAVLLYYYFEVPSVIFRALIIAAFANFFLFYNIFKRYSLRAYGRYSFTGYSKNKKKKSFKVRDNENNVTDFADYLNRKRSSDKPMPESITRHKCAICKRTEKDGNDLVFRFCTKCNGSYEYCDEHIYTHEHVK